MSSFVKKLYSPVLLDIVFAAVGLLSLTALVFGSGDGVAAIEAAEYPLRRGGIMVAILLAAILFASMGVRFDQRCADDYDFMMIAKSALIGMVTLIGFLAFWDVLFAENLGGMTNEEILSLALAGWSSSYFYTRLRGTVA